MPKYYVELEERFTYNLEIEAQTQAIAEDMAFNHPRYTSDEWDDNDAVIVAVGLLPDTHVITTPCRLTMEIDEHDAHRVLNEAGTLVAVFTHYDDAVDYIQKKEAETT